MFTRIIFLLWVSFFMLWANANSKPMSKQRLIQTYAVFLNKLKTEQYINLVLAYRIGNQNDLGLVLAAIVWKESGFGVNTVNSRDGQHGSFGLAQILLDTSMARNNITTEEGKKNLKFRLLTDTKFNLSEAVKELKGWIRYHRDVYKRKDWSIRAIASYNTGRRSYDHPRGKKYADDVDIRLAALRLFFQQEEIRVNKTMDKELNAIASEYRKKMLRK